MSRHPGCGSEPMDIMQDILVPVVEESRAMIASAAELGARPESPLFGEGSALDSLGLVQFVLLAEQRIEEVMDVQVRLVSEKAMSSVGRRSTSSGAMK